MVKVGVNDRKLIWKEHMKRLINAENKWRNDIAASKVVSAVRRIDAGEVRWAMYNMKNGEASGPSGIVLEILKTGG